jgi:hypothetical protein
MLLVRSLCIGKEFLYPMAFTEERQKDELPAIYYGFSITIILISLEGGYCINNA